MLRFVRIDKKFPEMAKLAALDKEAFPQEEYLSPNELMAMAEGRDFDFWGLFDGENFVGFMAVMLYQNLSYLFFLAIEKERRSKGYGAQALQLLKASYPDKQQVVDLEQPEKGALNENQREIRRAFYLHNGYQETGHAVGIGLVVEQVMGAVLQPVDRRGRFGIIETVRTVVGQSQVAAPPEHDGEHGARDHGKDNDLFLLCFS